MSEKARMAIFWTAVAGGFAAASLGLETREINSTGWLLFLVGLLASLGGAFGLAIPRFHTALSYGQAARALWLVVPGMLVVLLGSPLEYQFLPAGLPRHALMQAGGLGLAGAGLLAYFWSRRRLAQPGQQEPAARHTTNLVKRGGLGLVCLGVVIGYSSLAGLVGLIALVAPGMVWMASLEK